MSVRYHHHSQQQQQQPRHDDDDNDDDSYYHDTTTITDTYNNGSINSSLGTCSTGINHHHGNGDRRHISCSPSNNTNNHHKIILQQRRLTSSSSSSMITQQQQQQQFKSSLSSSSSSLQKQQSSFIGILRIISLLFLLFCLLSIISSTTWILRYITTTTSTTTTTMSIDDILHINRLTQNTVSHNDNNDNHHHQYKNEDNENQHHYNTNIATITTSSISSSSSSTTISSTNANTDTTSSIQYVQSIYELSLYHTESQKIMIPTTNRKYIHHIHNISTAICYKTLFGTQIDIGLILQWIAYHHLLGFDHFYFFYRNEVTILPNWDILYNLPFVTLIPWNDIGTKETYYNQALGTEVQCLTNYAVRYDWVFIADIDEYLYLGTKHKKDIDLTQQYVYKDNGYKELIEEYYNNNNNELSSNDIDNRSVSDNDTDDALSIKEFLYMYRNMTYLSFGKRMYTLDHRIDMEATNYHINTVISLQDSNQPSLYPHTNFTLSNYPYYMKGYFCHFLHYRRGDPICPTWRGRSKLIVRPQYHTFIDVHGNYRHPLVPNDGTIHFHPDLYHIKEWPHLYSLHNITQHYPPPSQLSTTMSSSDNDTAYNSDSPFISNDDIDNYHAFTIKSEEEVHIHNVHTGYIPYSIDNTTGMNEDIFLVQYDTTLQHWFQLVMNRATNQYGQPIRILVQQQQQQNDPVKDEVENIYINESI